MTVEELRDELEDLIAIGLRDAVVVSPGGFKLLSVERREGVWIGSRYEFGRNPAGTTRSLVTLSTGNS